jgi:hypothetical protein
MRTGCGRSLVGAALLTLLLAAPAQGHELTEKKAKNALKPVAKELIPTVAPVIAQKFPGATVTESQVAACRVRKSHRAECVILFPVQGVSFGELECGMDAFVRFKSKRSRKLEILLGEGLLCFFPVPFS